MSPGKGEGMQQSKPALWVNEMGSQMCGYAAASMSLS